jgi:hypothetical protein
VITGQNFTFKIKKCSVHNINQRAAVLPAEQRRKIRNKLRYTRRDL